MTDGVLLRGATDDDLPGIVDVFCACWQLSYAAALGPDFAASMTRDRALELWTARPLSNAIVAVQTDGCIVGVVRFDAPGVGSVAEVHSLYVSPAAQSGGIGGRLLDEAVAVAAAGGCVLARLWVFADNSPSIRFYERHGWTPDGRHRTEEGFGLPEQGMSIALAPSRQDVAR